jgi:Tfp pilus assembly protein PilF
LLGAALKVRPGSAWACSNSGVVRLALKHHAEAAASFERALAIKPNDAETLNNLARQLRAGAGAQARLRRGAQ